MYVDYSYRRTAPDPDHARDTLRTLERFGYTTGCSKVVDVVIPIPIFAHD